jgi:hypothetical protein
MRLMVHENFQKEQRKKENEEHEELLVSDMSEENGRSEKKRVDRMNTSFKIEDF